LLPLLAYGGYLYVAIRGALTPLRDWLSIAGRGGAGFALLRERLSRSSYESTLFLFVIYFALATPMLFMVLKSGSWLNFFLEWTCVLSVLVGLNLREAAMSAFARDGDRPPTKTSSPALALLMAAAVAAQAVLLTFAPNAASMWPNRDPEELAELVAKVSEAPRPVISDDMVLLLRGGKSVLWEPAIFYALARSGLWDERPFVDMIGSHAFAFFVTVGDERNDWYGRYTPLVAEAIRKAYPVKRRIAGYVLHLEEASQAN
jgi:hypothetical protein